MPPPWPWPAWPPAPPFSSLGFSAISASVVSIKLATDAAFCRGAAPALPGVVRCLTGRRPRRVPRLRVRPPPPNLVLGPCSLRARLRLRAVLRALACAARWGWSSLGCSHRSGSSRSHTDESCQSLAWMVRAGLQRTADLREKLASPKRVVCRGTRTLNAGGHYICLSQLVLTDKVS
jgi:hypothetical protein